MARLLLAIVLCLFIRVGCAFQLSNIMTHLRNSFFHHQTELSQYNSQLKSAEEKIAHLLIAKKNTSANITLQQKALDRLSTRIKRSKKALSAEQTLLAKQLKHTYMLGESPFLKLLLTANTPSKLNRFFVYYRSLNHARLMTIKRRQKTIKSLHKIQALAQAKTQELHLLKQSEDTQLTQLKNVNTQRLSIIKHLKNRLFNEKTRLSQLRHNKEILDHKEHTLITQAPEKASHNFAQYKGHYAWPAQGKIDNLFHHHIEHSDIRYQSVLIKAPIGSLVHAIAPGTVVFAQWLPGYGFVVIINHGHGYMSIYGRNQTLYTEKGAHIKKRQVIATVGKSGGFSKAALYFAIRKNARALNPSKWCR